MRAFILRSSWWAWGDYGHILANGFNSYRAPQSDLFQLERCGPFMPPITFPFGGIIVTDSFRKQIEGQNFNGISFLPVEKFHIVKLNWHEWDRESEDPELYPESREPEAYITERPHSQETADHLGDLWQIYSPVINTYNEEDLWKTHQYGYNYFSITFIRWLKEVVSDWIDIEEKEIDLNHA